MAVVSAWKAVQQSFILKECSVIVSVRMSDITKPPPVPCSVLDPSVKQHMPWVLASMIDDVRVECVFAVLCK